MMIQSIYDDMWQRFELALKLNEYELDPYLSDLENDTRRGITALAYLNQGNRSTINEITRFQKEVLELEPQQYYHPSNELHLTVLSVISCLPEFSVTEIDVNYYIDIFRSVLKNTGKIEIRYQGVSASPNCIVIQGFPISDTLKRLRNELRTQLIEAGVRVTFDSRYKLVTAHSSIIRFKAPLNDAQQLQEDIRIDPSRIALVGISMGAMSTFYSLTQNNQIKAAVPILGSPDFVGLEKFALKADSDNKIFNEDEKLAISYMAEIDPCLYLLENESRPMLIINGERDDWVPAKFARDFYEKVKSKYDKNNTEIAFNLADESHYFSNDMRDHTICWLNQHL